MNVFIVFGLKYNGTKVTQVFIEGESSSAAASARAAYEASVADATIKLSAIFTKPVPDRFCDRGPA